MDLTPDAEGRVPTMVFLPVPPDAARAMHRPGGTPPEEMHVTLLYLGPLGADDRAKVHKAVRKFAAKHGPVPLRTVGTARWLHKDEQGPTGEPDELTGPDPLSQESQQDLVSAAVDHPSFQTMFEQMRDSIKNEGVPYEGAHSYSPHITLGRLGHDEPTNPWQDIPSGQWMAKHVGVGEGTAQTHYPLQAPEEGGAMGKAEDVWLSKSEEQRIITGLVFVPGRLDSQGDRLTAREIERAHHEFMEEGQGHGSGGHWVAKDERIKLIETYIAPQDLTIEGHTVPEGSWVHSVKVPEDVWADAKKGKLLSFSPFGAATRVEEL